MQINDEIMWNIILKLFKNQLFISQNKKKYTIQVKHKEATKKTNIIEL